MKEQKELENIRNSVNRQAPLGQEQWQVEVATKYGMLSTLRRRGRPSYVEKTNKLKAQTMN